MTTLKDDRPTVEWQLARPIACTKCGWSGAVEELRANTRLSREFNPVTSGDEDVVLCPRNGCGEENLRRLDVK